MRRPAPTFEVDHPAGALRAKERRIEGDERRQTHALEDHQCSEHPDAAAKQLAIRRPAGSTPLVSAAPGGSARRRTEGNAPVARDRRRDREHGGPETDVLQMRDH